MKTLKQHCKLPLAVAMASLIMAGCSTVSAPEGSAAVRNKLTQLQTDQELASRAPVSLAVTLIWHGARPIALAEKPALPATMRR